VWPICIDVVHVRPLCTMFDMSTCNEKGKLVLKLYMLYFKEIIMTGILCSFCMYLVCYKLSISLAYLRFLCCYMSWDNCSMYTSRCIYSFWSTLKWYALKMIFLLSCIYLYICFDVVKDFMTLRWYSDTKRAFVNKIGCSLKYFCPSEEVFSP